MINIDKLRKEFINITQRTQRKTRNSRRTLLIPSPFGGGAGGGLQTSQKSCPFAKYQKQHTPSPIPSEPPLSRGDFVKFISSF